MLEIEDEHQKYTAVVTVVPVAVIAGRYPGDRTDMKSLYSNTSGASHGDCRAHLSRQRSDRCCQHSDRCPLQVSDLKTGDMLNTAE